MIRIQTGIPNGQFLGLLTIILLAAGTAEGQSTGELAKKIEGKLMAPCCWSQPVSQHDSPAATKIRNGIRDHLAAGKSEQQIVDLYVAEYGERILASPRASGFNLLAWVLPGVFAVAGAVVIWAFVRRSLSRRAGPAAEDEAERVADARLQARVEAEMQNLGA